MKIAFVSAEVVPFSKTGGLADVAGALPKCLEELGHTVVVFSPLYKTVKEKFHPRRTPLTINVPVGTDMVKGQLWEDMLPDSNVRIIFIGCDQYFNRDGLYGDAKGDYSDNCSRFVFFSRGVLEAIKALGFQADVIHTNDWQSGLIPVYTKVAYADDAGIARAANVYTVHNLAYQGLFWHWDIPLTNIGWEHFNYKELEFYGKINFMKGGIVFSDVITTVSPTYAKEIQRDEEFGAGLQGILSERTEDVYGIVNGVDYTIWSPEADALIPAKFSMEDLSGKAACKKALQQAAGLAVDRKVPVIGIISRLVDQKGFDLVGSIIDDLMKENLQIAVLGTGLEKYHKLFGDMAAKHSSKMSLSLKFDNAYAHLIEAGSDMFLMPSRYEPCGLNQLYSLKYGTVPVVRATGGLADTITDTNEKTLKAGTATGFSFTTYDSDTLLATIRRALAVYKDQGTWKQVMMTGMRQDYSWNHSAQEYADIYKEALSNKSKKAAGTATAI